ncbi:MAG: outer membrane beta-barrel protein [Gracilimonas sp.]
MKKLTILIFASLFMLLSTNYAHAQIDVGGGLIFGSGVFENTTVDNDFGLRVEGRYSLNDHIDLPNDFSVGADLAYFFPKEENDVKVSLFGVNLNAFYTLFSNDELNAYAIGGFNIAVVTVNVPEQTFNGQTFGGKDSETELGLNLGAGAEYGLDFGNLFGELKFGGLGGDADQLVISAGVRVPINMN